jgi:type IV pilus assembly protein PilB
VSERDLALALAEQAGLESVDVETTSPPADVLAAIEASTARTFRVLPVRKEGKTLVVALADPLNRNLLEDLRFLTGLDIRGAVCDEAALARAIERAYGAAEPRADERRALHEAAVEAARAVPRAAAGDPKAAREAARASPVVRLLNGILHQAIRDRASDIHLEPFEREFKIRYRVDGALYELEAPPAHLAVALISRVKVMASLDIAETRLPQDGRIELSIEGRPVDLRVSTLPTLHGESCVLRVLDRTTVALELDRLGLRAEDKEVLRRLLRLPHGILLVTGPTGSGKTTTLYSALRDTFDPGTKVVTVEDPVEYDLDGIVQIAVNEDIGVSYAKVLRTMLRHDPDRILIGEIRDPETAQIAIEASLTGHVVLSTLHTNDAPSAVARLLDLGVEPFLVAATLEGVLAQRLVRTICADCRETYRPDASILRELSLDPAVVGDRTFARGRGCETCHFSGHRGRTALYELMIVTDRLREAILEGKPTGELRRVALEEGLRTLRASGLLLLYDGKTSVEEILRETPQG